MGESAGYIVAKRRRQVALAAARGLSVGEISNSLQVPRRTIERDLSAIRRENSEWWKRNSDLDYRASVYLKERLTALVDIKREASRLSQNSSSEKTQLRGLELQLSVEEQIDRLLQFVSPELLTNIGLEKQLQDVQRQTFALAEKLHVQLAGSGANENLKELA